MVKKERWLFLNHKNAALPFFSILLLILCAIFVSAAAVITFVSPANNSYLNADIIINASSAGFVPADNVTNITMNISIGGAQIMYNTTSKDNITSFQYNWTTGNGSFADGTYVINLTFYTNFTSSNASIARTVVVDNTNPNNTITVKDQAGDTITTTGTVDFGDELTVTCASADGIASINITKSAIAVKFPGVSYYKNYTLSTKSATTLKTTIENTETVYEGKYAIKCMIYDNSTNSNTTYFNFTVQNTLNYGANSAAGGSGTAAIPGWENPVGTKKILSGVYVAKEALDTTGMSRLMLPGAGIELDIKGETHTVTVESMTAEEVVLTITSDPMEVTIKTGETGSYDLNGDGVDDLAITYHKEFVKTYADLTFALTEEPAAEPIEDVEEAPSEFEGETGAEEYVSPKGGLTITLAVIVIILIIGFALIKGKKM